MLIHDWSGEFQARDENIEQLIDKAEAEAEEKGGYAIEQLRKAFGPTVLFFELEPGFGPKDPEVITIASTWGKPARHPRSDSRLSAQRGAAP